VCTTHASNKENKGLIKELIKTTRAHTKLNKRTKNKLYYEQILTSGFLSPTRIGLPSPDENVNVPSTSLE